MKSAVSVASLSNLFQGSIDLKPYNELFNQISYLTNYLNSDNVEIAAHRPEAWSHFISLPKLRQQQIVHSVKRYYEAIVDIQESELESRNTAQSLWRIHSAQNWLINDEVINSLSDTDVVEIYMADQSPFYKNFNYYRYTSYTLSDLIFYTWPELIEHDNEGLSCLNHIASQIFLKNVSHRSIFKINPYVAKEKFSTGRLVVLLSSKSISPLKGKSSGINEAVLLIWKIEILKQP